MKVDSVCDDVLFMNRDIYGDEFNKVNENKLYTILDKTINGEKECYFVDKKYISRLIKKIHPDLYVYNINVHSLSIIRVLNKGYIGKNIDLIHERKLIDSELWDDHEFCSADIKHDGKNIKFIRNKINIYCRDAISTTPSVIDYLKDYKSVWRDPVFCLMSVMNNGNNIQYAHKITNKLCNEAVKNNPDAYLIIKNRRNDYNSLIKSNPYILRYINDNIITEDMCLIAVNINGLVLKYIKHKTYNICKAALLNNIMALIYI